MRRLRAHVSRPSSFLILGTERVSDTLFPPLLMHTPHASETHYFPLTSPHNRRILLHSHLSAPFIDHTRHLPSYVNLTIISSADGECQRDFTEFSISIDWTATLGRWASRYLHTLVSWAAGVASLVLFFGWAQHDTGGKCGLRVIRRFQDTKY